MEVRVRSNIEYCLVRFFLSYLKTSLFLFSVFLYASSLQIYSCLCLVSSNSVLNACVLFIKLSRDPDKMDPDSGSLERQEDELGQPWRKFSPELQEFREQSTDAVEISLSQSLSQVLHAFNPDYDYDSIFYSANTRSLERQADEISQPWRRFSPEPQEFREQGTDAVDTSLSQSLHTFNPDQDDDPILYSTNPNAYVTPIHLMHRCKFEACSSIPFFSAPINSSKKDPIPENPRPSTPGGYCNPQLLEISPKEYPPPTSLAFSPHKNHSHNPFSASVPIHADAMTSSAESSQAPLRGSLQHPRSIDLECGPGMVSSQAQHRPAKIQKISKGTYSCIEDCTLPNCDDGCSANDCPPRCIPACDGVKFCDNAGNCQSTDCNNTTCPETSPVCSDGSCPYGSGDEDVDEEPARAYMYGDEEPSRAHMYGDQEPSGAHLYGDEEPSGAYIYGNEEPSGAHIYGDEKPFGAYEEPSEVYEEPSRAYGYSNIVTDPSIHCRWEAPGQSCNVSVSTPNDLGRHVLHDHLEPQTTLTCRWDECTEVVGFQQLSSHVMQEHDSDRYVCLWQHCGLTFITHEALDAHIKLSHANLDCHWAGCEASAKDFSQLKSHVDMRHLGFGFASPLSTPSSLPGMPMEKPHSEQIYPRLHVPISARTDHLYTPEDNESLPPMLRKYILPIPGIHDSLPPMLHKYKLPIISVKKQESIQAPPASIGITPSFSISGPLENSNPAPLSSLKNSFRSSPAKKDEHTCEWLLETSPNKICGMQFSDRNKLQTHVDRDHIWTTHLRPKKPQMIFCKWQNCKRNGKTFQNNDKLRRHLFTHTGCECLIFYHRSINSLPIASINSSTMDQQYIYAI